ncbi:hypothetical protein V502_02334 [Pseudogymnoascus sp. VKM F-4520 (FW-2644)]|nr:hypothetical protein V502_02334 [Pseudogymnoascus sp. VKM F-4520 (FW-2644)]
MGYNTVTTSRTGAVLTATINNAPINLCDWKFMSDFDELLTSITSNGEIKILVVQSANLDFFVAHLDLLPRPDSTLPVMHPEYPTLGFFFGLMYKLTNLPVVTIALVEGCARAGGCDFTMAFDMRFGVKGRTRLSHVEACLGVYASGGGALRMAQQMGKPRALEYLYSGRDIEADEGEKYGLINRAFDTSVEMHEFADRYTARVGKFELTALAMAKKRVNDACNASSIEVFEKDFHAFIELLNLPKTAQLVGEVWKVIKGATDCDEERTLPDAIMTLPSYQ